MPCRKGCPLGYGEWKRQKARGEPYIIPETTRRNLNRLLEQNDTTENGEQPAEPLNANISIASSSVQVRFSF